MIHHIGGSVKEGWGAGARVDGAGVSVSAIGVRVGGVDVEAATAQALRIRVKKPSHGNKRYVRITYLHLSVVAPQMGRMGCILP